MATLNARETFRQQMSSGDRERVSLPLAIRKDLHVNFQGKERNKEVRTF